MGRGKRYLGAACVPVAVLLFSFVFYYFVFFFGTPIQLQVRLVDPRDLFRGDYLALELEQTDFPLASFDRYPVQAANGGVTASSYYVKYGEEKDGVFTPVSVSEGVPPKKGVYLRARVYRYGAFGGGFVKLDFGDRLARYYVKEGTGQELERKAKDTQMLASVRVWRGYAVITGLRFRSGVN